MKLLSSDSPKVDEIDGASIAGRPATWTQGEVKRGGFGLLGKVKPEGIKALRQRKPAGIGVRQH